MKKTILLLIIGLELVRSLRGVTIPWMTTRHSQDNDYDTLTPQELMPKILNSDDVIKVSKGDNVTLKCNVIRLGKFSVIWRKEDSILWVLQGNNLGGHQIQYVTKDKRIDQMNTSLVINRVGVADEAHYFCEVSPDTDERISHRLIVNVPPIARPKEKRNFVQAHEGETVQLECEVSGKPRPEVIWKRMDKKKFNGTSLDTILEIENVTSSDSGMYACIAMNSIGKPSRALITLQVHYAPIVSAIDKTVHSGVHYEATISCTVDAIPSPKIEWFKEGAPVNPMRLRKGIQKNNRFFLHFERVLYEDFGNYSCNASNYWGEGSADIELTGKPLVPKILSNSLGSFQDNFTLTWEVKSYAPITSYFVFLKNTSNEYGDEEWVNITIPGNPSSSIYHSQLYSLTDLLPNTRMVAKVQANNEFGESDFSDLFTFQTLEEDGSYSDDISLLEASMQKKLEGSHIQHDLENYSLGELNSALTSEYNGTNGTQILLSLLDEENSKNVSSDGVPIMTNWQKRTQLLSIVTAISLSSFFSLFAMRW